MSSAKDITEGVPCKRSAKDTAESRVPSKLARLDVDACSLVHPTRDHTKSRDEIKPPVQQQELPPQPDPDAIKMFVGQIPRSWDVSELRNLFEEFGKVHSVNVLRDRVTGNSRGCCFVTFYTRKSTLTARNELHNIRTLPGMHHPIQMKPADSETRNDRKLFIGMLSKKCDESDVRLMFSSFGTIEECKVLRDTLGHSKGCAFVTYSSRQSAINAMNSMDHSQTMKGCNTSLVVKFADTQREKDRKRQQQMITDLCQMANIVNFSQTPQTYMTQNDFGGFTQDAPVPNIAQLATFAAAYGGAGYIAQPSAMSPLTTTTDPGRDVSAADLQSIAALAQFANNPQTAGSLNPVVMQNIASAMASAASQAHGSSSGNSPMSGMSSFSPVSLNSFANGMTNHHQDLTQPYHRATTSFVNMSAIQSPVGKQIEGPEGANLFIYHLPQEFADIDLVQAFMPYGKVISAKVFVDKQTNLSKCFGFVSYVSPVSAQAAIQSMNGFQIGTKRLKVQLKRSRDRRVPY